MEHHRRLICVSEHNLLKYIEEDGNSNEKGYHGSDIHNVPSECVLEDTHRDNEIQVLRCPMYASTDRTAGLRQYEAVVSLSILSRGAKARTDYSSNIRESKQGVHLNQPLALVSLLSQVLT